jgi:1-acyl-sn-glycerol-3-phosphate acyltransferase
MTWLRWWHHEGVKTVRTTLWSLWFWLSFGTLVAVWLVLMAVTRLATAPWDKARYWTGYLFRKLPVVQGKVNPLWDFNVGGAIPSDPRRPYVVVANHESFVDILLISHLPFEMKWLSKIELFRLPVVGWLLRLADDIPLERGDRGSASEAMAACADRLSKRVSVMIFPEGTRATGDEMLPFKDGAFRLAIETQTPILPIAVHGTRTALQKHSWKLGESRARAVVLDPEPVDGLGLGDLDVLKKRVRDRIAVALEARKAAP